MLFSGTSCLVTPEGYASINLSLIYFSLHLTSVSTRKGISLYPCTHTFTFLCAKVVCHSGLKSITKLFSNAPIEKIVAFLFSKFFTG